ncbi:hypothetical protein [Streptomyces atratus]|uniref:hypothetical protein n=1 Tax=Streptomyces atratus TaxID=1893 RepID=UPI002253DFCB|nr:hypothetical protein [Streptomyces atratus]MCX5339739.1 hypothetical protein [Streptomyces atratus]
MQIQDLERRLTRFAERHAPQLLAVVGIGPDTAVTLLERTPGARQYRRLNRGGDRQANAALHRIV